MKEAVIVSVARTPIGKRGKGLASITAPKLGALAMKQAVEQVGLKPELLDEVIFGNLFNVDYGNPARVAVLEAGFPFEVPALTVDRQCSSSLNALALASSLIMTDACDVILTGGVESYSQMPLMISRPETPYPMAMNFVTQSVSIEQVGNPPMIMTAENLAEKYHISREECDAFAVESHKKAAKAWDRGFFDGEVFPVAVPQKKGEPALFTKDECVRADCDMSSLSKLKPVMKRDGVVTAGNASPMNDGASAVLVMSSDKAKELGLTPLAKVCGFASAGVDPNIMGIGPVYATQKLLAKTGLTVDDFDFIELNEAFAAQSIACIRELKLDMSRVNPNGGAIAIGHPNAASGGILVCRAARHMQEQNLKRCLISFCCGGGQGFSLILER